MTSWTLIRRGVRYHWRTHLGVALGAAAAAAVLAGAMVVGDSVRHSLDSLARARLGEVHVALASGDRYFRDALAGELSAALKAPAAAVLELGGVASVDAGARANGVQVLGVDEAFWALAPGGAPPAMGDDEVVINQRLAAQLGVAAGGEVLFRVPRPSLLPRDAPLSTDQDTSAAFRATVRAVATDEQFGRFGLQANQLSPYTAFLPRKQLQRIVDRAGQSNMLLVGPGPTGRTNADAADAALRQAWRLADAGMELRELPDRGVVELRTRRIFLDPPAAKAAAETKGGAVGVLTYFVNELRAGERATPYSMVAAIGPLAGATGSAPAARTLPADDEIAITRWLADDLSAGPGDTVTLTYFTLGPMRRLVEQSRRFRVGSVLPTAGDPTLMPEFPGVAAAETCGEWKPGIPIDVEKIRPKDEQYWTDHRGTPKAMISLPAGQAVWGNRFGDLTAVRWPLASASAAEVRAALRRRLAPSEVGLYFLPVRQRGLAAGAEALDFGGLFLSLSFFIIAAALLLTGLLFVLGVEQRGREVGTLLALGFGRWQVRRLLLGEGLCLAAVGVVVGTPAGLLYTKALLAGLAGVWGGAVAGSDIRFHVTAATLAAAAGWSLLAAGGAMALALWRQARAPAAALLAGAAELELRLSAGRLGRAKGGLIVGSVAAAAAAAVSALWGSRGGGGAAQSFFAAGALLLVAAMAFSQAIVAAAGRAAPMTLGGLGVRNAARRPGRSLATVAVLACGVFLVVSVGAFRLEVTDRAGRRDGGTGGFALLGESTLPVLHDLNTPAGRKAFGLDSPAPAVASVVPLRVRDGDDASCLNLNRPRNPLLLGVDPDALASRGAFHFVAAAADYPLEAGWRLLNERRGDEVPVVGDEATVVWALGKKLGDAVDTVDARGRTIKLRIVAMIANSVLQGALIVADDRFERMFPAESGYRRLLIDAPPASADAVAAELTRAGRDVGLQVTPAGRRLADLNVVQNTYLSIFQVLGGLGLGLGTVGLGVVLLRNVLQRRGELALMRALGFARGALYHLVLCEHLGLLALGVTGGVAAGLLAVAHALRTLPVASLALTVCAVALAGAVSMVLATAAALRGRLLAALRDE